METLNDVQFDNGKGLEEMKCWGVLPIMEWAATIRTLAAQSELVPGEADRVLEKIYDYSKGVLYKASEMRTCLDRFQKEMEAADEQT